MKPDGSDAQPGDGNESSSLYGGSIWNPRSEIQASVMLVTHVDTFNLNRRAHRAEFCLGSGSAAPQATLTRAYVQRGRVSSGDGAARYPKNDTGLARFREGRRAQWRRRWTNHHRMGLYDAIMIKDNHVALWGGGTIADAVTTARAKFPALKIEVEVDTLEQLEAVLPAKPDWVLLDNMTPETLKKAVKLCDGRCQTEASGGITLETIGAIAATGVDAVSVGALTHAAAAIDLGLDVDECNQ